MTRSQRKTSVVLLLFALLALFSSHAFAQWVALGPDGGDVRSLAYDPANPDRIFLGTSAGQLYVSNDNGSSWSRLARLGGGYNYVLDNMEIDPQSGTMYVAAWDGNIEHENGDLFRSSDGGKTWQALPGTHGKSIRSMALAPSDPRIVVVGALDGVFRSTDGGNTFARISPPTQAEIKDIESVAIDPKNPNVIYAGTWHLAWKTDDGGKSWHSIKQGVIDDSDVFSIIVDWQSPKNVYLSACSGIYKSENAAELFHKVQGIPFSARRTRVLKQDPKEPNVVYAGTTEGLWKTTDAGKSWQRITATNVIVNDIHIDPRRSSQLLIATDRGGVLVSRDAGRTFAASNRGFVHRYVSSVVADADDPRTIYAGLMNDKEFGGVYVSHNSGSEWKQLSAGLDGRDVFSLRQAANGALVAGTNRGIFLLEPKGTVWRPIDTVVTEKTISLPTRTRARSTKRARTKTSTENKTAITRVELVKAEMKASVSALQLTPKKWFAATSSGFYESADSGKTWRGGPIEGQRSFVAVAASGESVLAVAHQSVLYSPDAGASWKTLALPAYVTAVQGATIAQGNVLWLATREGALRSHDGGATWEHVLEGLPARNLTSMQYDPERHRLLAVADTGELFASTDEGESWRRKEAGFAVRSLAFAPGRLLAATTFDGVISESEAKVPQVGGGQ